MDFPMEYIYDEEFESLKEYADILNGVACFVVKNGWKPGYRNNMAVNGCICQHALGIDDIDPLGEFVKEKEGELAYDDYVYRRDNIAPYLESWHDDIWCYGLDIAYYESLYKSHLGGKTIAQDVLIKIVPESKEQSESNKEEN